METDPWQNGDACYWNTLPAIRIMSNGDAVSQHNIAEYRLNRREKKPGRPRGHESLHFRMNSTSANGFCILLICFILCLQTVP
ncbi:unnamed protein product [Victoria cruziana]